MGTSTYELIVSAVGTVPVSVAERGSGRPVLLLHGGGGPQTVAGFAELLATERPAHVSTPTHPGFAGTPRPDKLNSVRVLASAYAELLTRLDLRGVTVIGNSIGGWIAAELTLADPARIGALIIVDGVGIEVDGHPVVDFFSLTPRQVAELSYYDPDRYGIDPTKLPQEALAAMAGNRAALATYAGAAMVDAGLAARLTGIRVPSLVVWGDADRIVDTAYGRAFADSIPGARFELLSQTGHLPQIESPERLLEVCWEFATQSRR